MKSATWFWFIIPAMLALGVLSPPPVMGQVPGRSYWKTLSGANAVPLIFQSISGNTNPFDPSYTVNPDANISATMALAGYLRAFPLFGRATTAALLVPVGRISSDVLVASATASEAARGFGDPMLELSTNIIGPPAQLNLVDALRYEPGFSLDLLADLAVPIGEYNSDQSLNLGQNRWYGRLGAPIVWQFGPWVPGQRTTLEFLPGVWLFGPNNNAQGKKLETDPMFQVDAHLTRDFTERLWGALDGAWFQGGKSSVDGVEGKALKTGALGFTLGYQINENLSLTVGYKSTIKDSAEGAMQMDLFVVSFVAGWHSLIEGVRRLEGED